jgi:hypothetical protein
MKILTRTLLAALPACSAFVAPSANAAIINFISAEFTNVNQVVNTGTLIEAVNVGQANDTGGVSNGADTLAVTMNGVTFVSSTGEGGDIAAVNGTSFFRAFYHDPTVQAIVGLSESDANALLDSYEFGGGVGNTLARFEGLVEGQAYLVQLFNSAGGAASSPYDYGYNETPIGDPNAFSTSDGTFTLEDVSTTPTSIITGTFIADATGIQDVHIEAQNSGLNLEVNAFQLRAIPEPSSLVLLGLGGLCILRRRRG